MPLILTESDLTELLHKKLARMVGYCRHGLNNDGTGKLCEELAKDLMHSGAIQKADVFVGSLKDNEVVQGIIMEAMAGAWDEGFNCLTGVEDNPYG
jgi:hypothetical protein